MEKQAQAALQLGDSSSEARASELWSQAGQQWHIAGNDSASAAAFEQAGRVARLAGDTVSAFHHYGTALQTRDSTAPNQIHEVLALAPPKLRGNPDLESLFVGKARALLVALGILDAAEARRSIRSAVDAYGVLEDLAAGNNQVLVRLESKADTSLEVRMRRWITQYKSAPWTTVRVDSAVTLMRPPMHYEFCYLDPDTHLPMMVDQPCADGCTVPIPSAHATSGKETNPPCAGAPK